MSNYFTLTLNRASPVVTMNVFGAYTSNDISIEFRSESLLSADITNLSITSGGDNVTYNHTYHGEYMVFTISKDDISGSTVNISGHFLDNANNPSNAFDEDITFIRGSSLYAGEITRLEPRYKSHVIDKSERGDLHQHDYYRYE